MKHIVPLVIVVVMALAPVRAPKSLPPGPPDSGCGGMVDTPACGYAGP